MPGNWPQTALLHDHGDGSKTVLSKLQELYKLAGLQFPLQGSSSLPELYIKVRRWFHNSNIDIVKRFGLVTNVLQQHRSLVLFAQNYVSERAQQGYTYCEMTIAPQYHTKKGLTEKEVVSALIEGIKLGEKEYPKIEVNILFSIGREVASEEAVSLVNIAGECDRDYVVGIGLVCNEAAHPPEKHAAMFRRAKELEFYTTCHAGEWVDNNPDFERDLPLLLKNIRTAVVDLGVNRVGHATALAYDSELIKRVVDNQIGIEGCPGSNFDSGLIPDTACLKIRELLEANVIYSLHPDDDLFLPDLETTFALCDKEYRFTEEEKQKLLRNAWTAKFGGRKYL
jgi:adenosine deaminase